MKEKFKMEANLLDKIDNWLEITKKRSVKPSTYNRLIISRNLLERYDICRMDVQDITSDDIQEFINDLSDEGYSYSSVKKEYNLLTAYLKWAISKGEIVRPVYLGVELPIDSSRYRKGREIKVYSPIEQKRLMKDLQTLEHDIYGAAILMLETGMRIGEVLALTWCDILWERRAVSVTKTLVRLPSEKGLTFVQDSPKSDSSNRLIPLSVTAMDVLKRLQAKAASGRDFIFAGEDDFPVSYFTFKYHISALCEKIGIQYKGSHAFRHSFATNCYHRGCDVKILSKLLGHADVAITYNIYIHLYGDELEEMRKVIG